MEFISGIREKEVLGIQEVISGDYEGRTVRMNGTVHTIRHMGEVAFVILRKAEGLVQCVCEGASGRKTGGRYRQRLQPYHGRRFLREYSQNAAGGSLCQGEEGQL